MKLPLLLLIFCIGICFTLPITAQTFSGSGGSVGLNTQVQCFGITVSGLPQSVNGSFGLESVCLTALHTWNADLDITLFAPDGTQVLLSADNGFDGDSYLQTCFTATAAQHISFAYAPMTGNWLPQQRLGVVNNGQNPNGIWQLCVRDDKLDNHVGEVQNWSLSFSETPAPPPTLPDQTFTAAFMPPEHVIPSDGTLRCFPVTVSGLPDVLNNDYGFAEICLNITHPWVEDVSMWLTSPDGTEVWLTHYNGGSGDNFTNTCFNMSASVPVSNGSAPFNGSYIPIGDLSAFNNGQNPNGIWQLCIYDNYPFVDDGFLHNFTLRFSEYTAVATNPYLNFTQSNLPIMVINTNGQNISDDPKITADMGIIDNPSGINYLTDPFNGYEGKIGIEIRGTSSQSFPKKGYGFETQNEDGSNRNVSLLGLPEENDWVLHGPYSDKTLMRNALAYRLARNIDAPAMRTRFCELVINNDYRGVYVLIEKIKRDKNRIDIAELTPADVEGDQLTGGYMLKIDWGTGGFTYAFTSPHPANNGATIDFQYEEPDYELVQPQHTAYISNYVTNFENALASPNFTHPTLGYKPFVNLQSFMDYFIINEACKNIDAYRLSTFLYKDKDSKDGRLTMGPVWDFNLSLGNADYLEGWNPQNWYYTSNESIPFWWVRLMQDPDYVNQLRCRWNDLRQHQLHTDTVLAIVNNWVALLQDAQKRNFERWQTLGAYVWPNPVTPDTYEGEITVMRNWIIQRLAWIDANLPGACPDVAIFRGKLFLQGSLDTLSLTLNTQLQNSSLLPNQQPFNTEPYNYPGTENITTLPPLTADWALVELYTETGSTPLAQRACLLTAQGFLHDVNGKDYITFTGMPRGKYRVVVKAPAHIGVATSKMIDLPNYDPYNFTVKAGAAFQKLQVPLTQYYFGLPAGDVDGNGIISVNDKNRITALMGNAPLYNPADLNRDGAINETDLQLHHKNGSLIGVNLVKY
ncbi:MAG TPA: CotH kinase family protein [Chitinophagales bacterium]|nr:CotH kinase family protein [Chitinophagales bacterium]